MNMMGGLMKLNCCCNQRKPMLGLFLKFWKPMNLNYFRNERKPMLGLFLKFWKPMNLNCFWIKKKGNVWIVSEVFKKPITLNCFCNARKPILGLFLKFQKPMKLNLLLQWAEANVGIVFAMSKSQCWDYFWCFGNQWIWVAFAISESQMLICFPKVLETIELQRLLWWSLRKYFGNFAC
jgi:hypothetical protein